VAACLDMPQEVSSCKWLSRNWASVTARTMRSFANPRQQRRWGSWKHSRPQIVKSDGARPGH